MTTDNSAFRSGSIGDFTPTFEVQRFNKDTFIFDTPADTDELVRSYQLAASLLQGEDLKAAEYDPKGSDVTANDIKRIAHVALSVYLFKDLYYFNLNLRGEFGHPTLDDASNLLLTAASTGKLDARTAVVADLRVPEPNSEETVKSVNSIADEIGNFASRVLKIGIIVPVGFNRKDIGSISRGKTDTITTPDNLTVNT